MASGLLALMIAASFTGAAVYVSFAEQPARLMLEDRALLTEWKPSYKRGSAMQAPLALAGSRLGIDRVVAGIASGFLIGAILMIAPWPWTIFIIKPTNDALLATGLDQAGPPSRELIVKSGPPSTQCAPRWARLHRSRSCGRVGSGRWRVMAIDQSNVRCSDHQLCLQGLADRVGASLRTDGHGLVLAHRRQVRGLALCRYRFYQAFLSADLDAVAPLSCRHRKQKWRASRCPRPPGKPSR